MDVDKRGVERAMEELKKREAEIAAREEALQKREAEVAASEDSAKRRPLRPSENVYLGENPYKFEVFPLGKTNSPAKVIECCDETEALRWYQATTEDPDNPGKQIDLVRNKVSVRCLSPEREARWDREKRIAAARRRHDAGFALTEQELALLEGQI